MFSQMLSNVFAAIQQSDCQQACRILADAFPGVEESRLCAAVLGTGISLYAQGKLEEADNHFRLVLAMYERCFPAAHAQALGALQHLLHLLEESNKPDEVESVLRRYEALARKAAGASPCWYVAPTSPLN